MWQVLQSKTLQKQLKKMDSQIARNILEDMESLKQDPMRSSVLDGALARKLGIRYIKVARDWRLFFRFHGKDVLAEFVFKRETAYEEIARYLQSLVLRLQSN